MMARCPHCNAALYRDDGDSYRFECGTKVAHDGTLMIAHRFCQARCYLRELLMIAHPQSDDDRRLIDDVAYFLQKVEP